MRDEETAIGGKSFEDGSFEGKGIGTPSCREVELTLCWHAGEWDDSKSPSPKFFGFEIAEKFKSHSDADSLF